MEMKLAHDRYSGRWVALPPAIAGLLARLEALSRRPEFLMQREVALSRALRSYLSAPGAVALTPLPQEVHAAELLLYADYYPDDGQLTLIEQLRDVITEHIPDEERGWLDPLKHSYLDLVEVLSTTGSRPGLSLRSLGDGRRYHVRSPAEEFSPGEALLTRLIGTPESGETDEALLAGSVLCLAADDAKAAYQDIDAYRRELEVTAGSFELRDWPEYAKRYGHMLLGVFAGLRAAALADAVAGIRYVTADDRPYLYTLALYEHREFTHLADSLSDIGGFSPEPAGRRSVSGCAARPRWIMAESAGAGDSRVAARLTLTPSQLLVECDSAERLDAVKHALAAAYGFSLHFRGEVLDPPTKTLTVDQLAAAEPLVLRITPEEDWAHIGAFLETIYLEWADRASPFLGGRTPRQAAAASAADRKKVADLITAIEQDDLGQERTGAPAFDYNKLRAHVGLDEVAGG